MLYAFDLLKLDGEDLRDMRLGDRKKRLARLPGRRRIGIVLSDHTTEEGALLFIHAYRMGLEGIVSTRLDRAFTRRHDHPCELSAEKAAAESASRPLEDAILQRRGRAIIQTGCRLRYELSSQGARAA
jgi:hypothetical protein